MELLKVKSQNNEFREESKLNQNRNDIIEITEQSKLYEPNYKVMQIIRITLDLFNKIITLKLKNNKKGFYLILFYLA